MAKQQFLDRLFVFLTASWVASALIGIGAHFPVIAPYAGTIAILGCLGVIGLLAWEVLTRDGT